MKYIQSIWLVTMWHLVSCNWHFAWDKLNTYKNTWLWQFLWRNPTHLLSRTNLYSLPSLKWVRQSWLWLSVEVFWNYMRLNNGGRGHERLWWVTSFYNVYITLAPRHLSLPAEQKCYTYRRTSSFCSALRTHGRTARWMDWRTDGQTDGRMDGSILWQRMIIWAI